MHRIRAGRAALLALSGVMGLLLVGGVAGAAHPAVVPPPVNCSTGLVLDTSQVAGPAPLFVTFTLTSYWGTPTVADWNFGDGAYFNGSGAAYLHPSHRYADIGTFIAIVQVSDGTRSGACSVGIQATAPPLSVHASGTPLTGSTPLTVRLSGTVAGGTGTFSTVSWSFGDGNGAVGYNLSYTYSVPGTYLAQFTVIDSAGNVGNATLTIQVLPAGALPQSGPVNLGTLSIVGAIAATIAAFGGAVLYVRTRSVEFAGGSGPDDAGDTAAIELSGEDTDLAEGGMAEPAPEEWSSSTEIEARSGSSVYAPQSYRGVFLDLSERDFDVLGSEGPETTALARRDEDRGIASAERPRGPKLSHRVVLHLFAQPRLGLDDTATVSFTQAGMTDELGVPQSLLSNVLRRLIFSGLLSAEVRHVQGSRRRLNVYQLTSKGEHYAARLREKYAAAPASPEPEADADRTA